MNKRAQGKLSETEAVRYLKSRGYEILGRNYTIRGGEIDIIARDAAQIVFVEVKSLVQSSLLQIEELLSERKQRTLARTCQVWLLQHNLQEEDWRIDFIGIVTGKQKQVVKLQHIENALG